MNRPEVSKKNKYWITRHRFYELKHFCLQYPQWKHHLEIISNWPNCVPSRNKLEGDRQSRPTEQIVMKRTYLTNRIKMLEDVAQATDKLIGPYILKGVTEGRSYDQLSAYKQVPCSKDTYYDLYRRFFWLLDQARQ